MSKWRAFTLIELLVVIAVIAVLMAIIMPALKKAKEQAQGAFCKANLKTYTYAVQMYADDNDDKFCDPQSCYFTSLNPYPGEGGDRWDRWCNGNVYLKDHPEYASEFFKYLTETKSLICPTFKTLAKSTRGHKDFDTGRENVVNYLPWHNYTMNAYLGLRSGDKNVVVLKITKVRNPGTTFSFADESCLIKPGYNTQGLNDTALYPIHPPSAVPSWIAKAGGSPWDVRPGPPPEGMGEMTDVIAGFHNAPSGNPVDGKGNCAFLDGHVSAHPRSESFPLAYPR